jgi:hypothetical protein
MGIALGTYCDEQRADAFVLGGHHERQGGQGGLEVDLAHAVVLFEFSLDDGVFGLVDLIGDEIVE